MERIIKDPTKRPKQFSEDDLAFELPFLRKLKLAAFFRKVDKDNHSVNGVKSPLTIFYEAENVRELSKFAEGPFELSELPTQTVWVTNPLHLPLDKETEPLVERKVGVFLSNLTFPKGTLVTLNGEKHILPPFQEEARLCAYINLKNGSILEHLHTEEFDSFLPPSLHHKEPITENPSNVANSASTFLTIFRMSRLASLPVGVFVFVILILLTLISLVF